MSGLPWFRAYADMVDNETLRLLAFEDRWHFVAILCCKCAGILDGGDPLPLLRRKMGVKLGLAARELDAMADRLGELGLIDAETFQPTGWDDLQFKSDRSTERVRAYRERQAKRAGNVSETAQDKDSDTELLSEKVTTPPAAGGAVGHFEGHATPIATPNPVAAFARAMIAAGVRVTALNPDLIAYVAEGGTVEHLQQVMALPECAGKPATYAVRIARREVTQPAAPVAAGGGRYAAPAEPRRVASPEQTRAQMDAVKPRRAASTATAQDALALAKNLLKGAHP